MPEDQQFMMGAEVRCTDGDVCGEIRYLTVNPAAHTLTNLAVEEKGRQGLGRLVPVGDVRVDPETLMIEFLGTMADFQNLPAADVTEFAADTVGYEQHGPEQLVEEPEYSPQPGEQIVGGNLPGVSFTETVDEVPDNDVEIRRHAPVHAGRHQVGQVQGVLIDPGDHRVTGVLLQVRHFMDRKEVAVPVDDVMQPFGQDGIRLKISRRDVENLPPWDSGHPGG
jgi:sporulation protein YlmC with PRC-barrel domain